jgi:hypothetical protein
LIAKWEYQVHQQGDNIIRLELKMGIEGKLPNINIITCRGEKTGADATSQPKIHKAIPKDDRYDLVKQKLIFKNEIEICKIIPTP